MFGDWFGLFGPRDRPAFPVDFGGGFTGSDGGVVVLVVWVECCGDCEPCTGDARGEPLLKSGEAFIGWHFRTMGEWWEGCVVVSTLDGEAEFSEVLCHAFPSYEWFRVFADSLYRTRLSNILYSVGSMSIRMCGRMCVGIA